MGTLATLSPGTNNHPVFFPKPGVDKIAVKLYNIIMYNPEIRFTGPEYDGIEHELGKLGQKLINIVNDHARNTLGKTAIPNPTDIEVTPHVLDEPKFLVRAWHETAAPAGMVGVLQRQEVELSLEADDENLFLTTDAESAPSYPLTTREAFLITGVGAMATLRSMFADPTLNEE